jgi:hypothetical protein
MKIYVPLTALMLAGCAGSLPPLPPAPMGVVRVREYVDSVKTDSGDQYQRVEYMWDYDRKSAVKVISSMDGQRLSETLEPDLTLVTTEAELNYAYALVRRDARLGKLVNRTDAHFAGGFALRSNGEPGCGAGSRCIHVIVSGGNDGEVPIVHAIVDLATRKITAPFYSGVSPQLDQ